MNFIKLIPLLFLVTLLNSCREEKKEEKKEEKLNILYKKDISKVESLLSKLGAKPKNSLINNNTEAKPWFWEIYFDTTDTITWISAIYTRNLTSPYLTRHPFNTAGETFKLQTFDFGVKDSTKTKDYKSSLFPLDSINLKLLPNLANKAMQLHQKKHYRNENDTIVGVKIYISGFLALSKIKIMFKIGDLNQNHFRHPTNQLSDKLNYATYEFTHKGKLLYSEYKGRNRKYYDK